MRTLEIGTNKYTTVSAMDEKGAGGANHQYCVFANIPNNSSQGYCETHFADISFQNGAIKENGVNGCHNEDLIAIVIDRLQGFQAGEYACKENERAIIYLNEALSQLDLRTQTRIERGVEGTSIK
ncbi:MAG: hypothetical protein WCG95_00210 [bacterium]